MVDHSLLTDFLQIYAFQPATALWRAVEVDVFKRHLPHSSRCLDLGCGDGKLTNILFNSINDVYLVGIDGDYAETTQATRIPIYKKVHTSLASNIPELGDSFDLVISNSVLEHIRNLEPVIAEVSRVLKAGGSFVFTVPGPAFHNCLRGLINKQVSRDQYLREIDQRLAHHHYLSVEDWKALLLKFQIEIKEHVEYLNCIETQRWEIISNLTGGLLWHLGGKTHAPINLQRKFGLRKFQNEFKIPRGIASLLAKTLLIGMTNTKTQSQNACLLIVAQKT